MVIMEESKCNSEAVKQCQIEWKNTIFFNALKSKLLLFGTEADSRERIKENKKKCV